MQQDIPPYFRLHQALLLTCKTCFRWQPCKSSSSRCCKLKRRRQLQEAKQRMLAGLPVKPNTSCTSCMTPTGEGGGSQGGRCTSCMMPTGGAVQKGDRWVGPLEGCNSCMTPTGLSALPTCAKGTTEQFPACLSWLGSSARLACTDFWFVLSGDMWQCGREPPQHCHEADAHQESGKLVPVACKY